MTNKPKEIIAVEEVVAENPLHPADTLAGTDSIVVDGEYDDFVELGYNYAGKDLTKEYPVFLSITEPTQNWNSACAGLTLENARELRDKLNEILGDV